MIKSCLLWLLLLGLLKLVCTSSFNYAQAGKFGQVGGLETNKFNVRLSNRLQAGRPKSQKLGAFKGPETSHATLGSSSEAESATLARPGGSRQAGGALRVRRAGPFNESLSSRAAGEEGAKEEEGRGGGGPGQQCVQSYAEWASPTGSSPSAPMGEEEGRLEELLRRYYRVGGGQRRGLASSGSGSTSGAELVELPEPLNVQVLIMSWYPPVLKLSWQLNLLAGVDLRRLNFYDQRQVPLAVKGKPKSEGGISPSSRRANQSERFDFELELEMAAGGSALETLKAIQKEPLADSIKSSNLFNTVNNSAQESQASRAENPFELQNSALLDDIRRRRFLIEKSLTCFQVTYNIVNSRFKVIEEYPAYLRAITLERLLPATEYSLQIGAIYFNGKYRRLSERVQFVSPTDNESRRFKENTYRPIQRYPDRKPGKLRFGLEQARGEELTIVAIAIAFWLATIYAFFNKWGKIRMLEPYQPAYRESASAALLTAAHHHPSMHNLIEGAAGSGSPAGAPAAAALPSSTGSVAGLVGATGALSAVGLIGGACGKSALDGSAPLPPASRRAESVSSSNLLAMGRTPSALKRTDSLANSAQSGSLPGSTGNQELQQQRARERSARTSESTLSNRRSLCGTSAQAASPISSSPLGKHPLLLSKRFETLAGGDFPQSAVSLRRTDTELSYVFQAKAQALAKVTSLWSRQQQFRSRMASQSERLSELELLRGINRPAGSRSQKSSLWRHSLLMGSQCSSSAGSAGLPAMNFPTSGGSTSAQVRPPSLTESLTFGGTKRSSRGARELAGEELRLLRGQRSVEEPHGAPRKSERHLEDVSSREPAGLSVAGSRARQSDSASLKEFSRRQLRYKRQSKAIDCSNSAVSLNRLLTSGCRSLDANYQQAHQQTALETSAQDSSSVSKGTLEVKNKLEEVQLGSSGSDASSNTVEVAEPGRPEREKQIELSASNKLRRLLFISKSHQHHHIATSVSSTTLTQRCETSLSLGGMSSSRRQLKTNSASLDSYRRPGQVVRQPGGQESRSAHRSPEEAARYGTLSAESSGSLAPATQQLLPRLVTTLERATSGGWEGRQECGRAGAEGEGSPSQVQRHHILIEPPSPPPLQSGWEECEQERELELEREPEDFRRSLEEAPEEELEQDSIEASVCARHQHLQRFLGQPAPLTGHADDKSQAERALCWASPGAAETREELCAGDGSTELELAPGRLCPCCQQRQWQPPSQDFQADNEPAGSGPLEACEAEGERGWAQRADGQQQVAGDRSASSDSFAKLASYHSAGRQLARLPVGVGSLQQQQLNCRFCQALRQASQQHACNQSFAGLESPQQQPRKAHHHQYHACSCAQSHLQHHLGLSPAAEQPPIARLEPEEEEASGSGARDRISSVFVASPYTRAHRDSFAMLRALSQKKSKSAEDVACLSSLVLQIWIRDRNPLLARASSQQQLPQNRRKSTQATSLQQHHPRARQRPKSSLTVSHLC